MDQIVLQMGQKMGVKISDEQLDQAIANIAKQNNITPDQMRSRTAYDGISYATYRNQIRKEMLISEVRNNEVRRRVSSCLRKWMPRRNRWVIRMMPALNLT